MDEGNLEGYTLCIYKWILNKYTKYWIQKWIYVQELSKLRVLQMEATELGLYYFFLFKVFTGMWEV